MNPSNTSRDVEFRRIIEGYIAVSGLTKKQVSANLGISSRSLNNYLKVPGMFRLSDVRRLCDMLHIKEEERRRLL